MDLAYLKSLAKRIEYKRNSGNLSPVGLADDLDEWRRYPPSHILALIARLEAAERVVEAAKCACGLIRNKAFDLPDAIAAYDRATAEAAKEVGDAER